MTKALALLSGGLDSLLAVRLLQRHGVAVECVHFVTGFNHRAYQEAVEQGIATQELPKVHVEDIGAEYFRRVALGVGRDRRDPCVGCRVLMLEKSAALARRRGAELLVTGEVVGQGARGQSRADLLKIEQAAGVEGRVWRPLSAAFLPEPTPPCAGLDPESREALRQEGKLQGRSRRGQFALAERLGLGAYPTPSGGCCRLTDPRFVRRLQDEVQHRDDAEPSREELGLLSQGRHFRLASRVKAILGRDATESMELLQRAGRRWTFQVEGQKGAAGVVLGDPGVVGFEEVGSLAVRYSSHRDSQDARVVFRGPGQRRIVRSRPAGQDYLQMVRV